MPAASDLAELSSVSSQLGELIRRVEDVAVRYQATPDSAVASDLFEVERGLRSANRVLERAIGALSDLTR